MSDMQSNSMEAGAPAATAVCIFCGLHTCVPCRDCKPPTQGNASQKTAKSGGTGTLLVVCAASAAVGANVAQNVDTNDMAKKAEELAAKLGDNPAGCAAKLKLGKAAQVLKSVNVNDATACASALSNIAKAQIEAATANVDTDDITIKVFELSEKVGEEARGKLSEALDALKLADTRDATARATALGQLATAQAEAAAEVGAEEAVAEANVLKNQVALLVEATVYSKAAAQAASKIGDSIAAANIGFDALVDLPEVQAGARWVKDAGLHAGLMAQDAVDAVVDAASSGEVQADVGATKERASEGASCVKSFIEDYGVDDKIVEVLRDWVQIMSLFFSDVLPDIPAFSAGVGYIFNIVALDWAALFAFASDPQTRELANLRAMMVLYILSTILFLLFIFLWCSQVTMKATPRLSCMFASADALCTN